jgi:methylenetetrahydrofolate reductase (NADPH)
MQDGRFLQDRLCKSAGEPYMDTLADKTLNRSDELKIGEMINSNRPMLSFEFFPPKTSESEHVLHETVGALRRFNPDFVSVTYGAGGTTRDRTLHWTLDIRDRYDLDVMMHLTCIGSSKTEIEDVVNVLKTTGIRNVLALRGDSPENLPSGEIKNDFRYAFELVEYLKESNGFSIGVAGYPEGHLEAPSMDQDIIYLKKKVDAGAEFIITQLFFDNRYFFDFVEKTIAAGINVPIIPGIMPIINLGQVQRFTSMCGATVPARLVTRMTGKNPSDTLQIGVDYAVSQCTELLDSGAMGLHFYTLNRNQSTEMILDRIGRVFHETRRD